MLKHLLRGRGSSIQGDSWVATLGGSDIDYGYSVAVAPDGSVYVCGYTTASSARGGDLFLAKFSSSGTVQWQKTFGDSSPEDYCYSLAVAPDGSVYVCGYTYASNGKTDLLLVKFSNSGTLQWQRKLGGTQQSYEYGRSVAVAPDGSVYVCGDNDRDLLLIKFSSSGTLQWQKTFGGSGPDYGQSVAVAPDGSVYVCGYNTEEDLLLAKLSSSGTVQWQKTLGGRHYDYGYSVAVAPDGSVYVSGYTNSVSAGGYDLLFAKFSSSGTVQWQKTLGGSGWDNGRSVAVAQDGSVYVCGTTTSAGAGSYDLLLVKFSSSGTVQWQKTLGGRAIDHGQSVAVAPDGSVYVCGYTLSTGAGEEDLLLAKITDSLIEKGVGTFDIFTFQDVSLTSKNVSLTIMSPSFSVSDAGLTVSTPSLTVETASFTTNLYTYKE